MRSSPTLFAITLAVGCIPEARLKLDYDDRPFMTGDGWLIASPAEAGFDPDKLARAYRRLYSEDELPGARSLLVVRGDRLVAEGYCRDRGDREHPRAIMSATKSVTSLLTGMAIADGLLREDETLATLLPEAAASDPRKGAITISHLLTMRSGLAFSNDDFSLEIEHGGHADTVRHTLGKPLATLPGERFDYRDADPFLLGAALERRLGGSLAAYARQRLFAPLGIARIEWQQSPDGVTYGPFGLFLRPRDLARLGLLVARGGQHAGSALVPAAWIERSSQPLVPATAIAIDVPDVAYGYYWWVLARRQAVLAWGHGGQYVYVAPSKDLVVVMTGEPNAGDNDAEISVEQLLSLVDVIEAARIPQQRAP